MTKDYFKIEEGQQLDSIQDVYLTYTTIMKNLIDTNTYLDMMNRVVKDIYLDDEIIKKVKKLKRKQRLFLAPIIYNYARAEFDFTRFYTYAQSQKSSRVFGKSQYATNNPYQDFLERFEEAFHRDVYEKCVYDYEASKFSLYSNFKIDRWYITMYRGNHRNLYEEFGKMVVRYDEKNYTLKVSYIEYIEWNGPYSRTFGGPQHFRLELFKGVRRIMNQLTEEYGKEPKVICHKKYISLLEEAKERGYLDPPKPDEELEWL